MYNESIKLKWIEKKEKETTLPPGALYRAFLKMEEFEERFKKDVSEFALLEIFEAYGTLNFISTDSLVVHNSYLSQYTQYCIMNNISYNTMNHFDEITTENVFALTNIAAQKKRVLSKKEIMNILDKLPYYVDKFVVLSFFEGLNGEFYSDIRNLKITDINSEKNTFMLERGELEVSKELVNIALEAYEEKSYSRVDGEGRNYHPYVESEYVFKEFSQNRSDVVKVQGRRIQTKMHKIFDYLDMSSYMSISALINSGKIHWLKENCSAEEIVSIFYKGNANGKILVDNKAKERFEYQFDTPARRSWHRKFSGYLE